MKKICFISGSRADYGLMMNLMKLVKKESNLSLQLIATGTHLSVKHGLTYKEFSRLFKFSQGFLRRFSWVIFKF